MEIPVLLEPLPSDGFRAHSGAPLELTARGDSPDSALRNLRELFETRIASGSVLTTIEVRSTWEATAQTCRIRSTKGRIDSVLRAIHRYPAPSQIARTAHAGIWPSRRHSACCSTGRRPVVGTCIRPGWLIFLAATGITCGTPTLGMRAGGLGGSIVMDTCVGAGIRRPSVAQTAGSETRAEQGATSSCHGKPG